MKDYITAPKTEPAYLVPINRRDQPKLLAELFCGLDSEGQAQFFDRVAQIDREHSEGKGVFQWRSMQVDLSDRANQVIVDMYEHTRD
jgi:hypothetical protein